MKRWVLGMMGAGWIAVGWGYPGVFVEGTVIPRMVFPELAGASGVGTFLAYPAWVDWSQSWEFSGGTVWLPLNRRTAEVGGWVGRRDWGVGGGWVWQEVGQITLRDIQGNVMGEARVGTHLGGISFQRRWHPQMSVGVSLLGIYRDLWADRGLGIALGGGVAVGWKAWTFHGGLRRLWGEVAWKAGYTETLSPVGEGGVVWSGRKFRIGIHGTWAPVGVAGGIRGVWYPLPVLAVGGGWSSQTGGVGGVGVGTPAFRVSVVVFQDPISGEPAMGVRVQWSGEPRPEERSRSVSRAQPSPVEVSEEPGSRESRRSCSGARSMWEFLKCKSQSASEEE